MSLNIISSLKSKILFNKSSFGQIFIISKNIDTFFCFNNYQNFLLPQEKKELKYKIHLFNSSGKLILSKNYIFMEKQSNAISIKTLLKDTIILSNTQFFRFNCLYNT